MGLFDTHELKSDSITLEGDTDLEALKIFTYHFHVKRACNSERSVFTVLYIALKNLKDLNHKCYVTFDQNISAKSYDASELRSVSTISE